MPEYGPEAVTSTVAAVAGTVGSVQLFSAADAYKRTIFNDSTATCYVLLGGGTASTSNYSVQIPASGYYEFPAPLYSGPVNAIWASAAGTAYTTWW